MTRTALLALLLSACDGEEDVALDGGSPPEGGDCAGADPFAAGVSATTALGRTVAITEADPTPPDVGDNRWTVAVEDAGGPVAGLTPIVRPWMPQHGHGLVPSEYAAADAGDGTYEVAPFDLIMPGLWEFTVELEPGAADPDAALFRFCAEG